MQKFLLIIVAVLLCFQAKATEEIITFHSDIQVEKDRSILVTETIKVNVEGVNIQRGIFRNIVTAALDENGRRVSHDTEVLEVLKNGMPENFSVSAISGGLQVKIGSADVILSPDEYTYTIRYRMENQVRFFENYDEIYWNVTGNEWDFVIREASAKVILPEDATIMQHKGYSGSYGASGCNCVSEVVEANVITYTTTMMLGHSEGLTIAVGWNKGVVAPPTAAELRQQEIEKHFPLIVGLAGLLLIVGYYLFAWFKVGKDPEKGVIIPRFDAPAGYSPAATRFVHEMGFDKKAFTASVVNMAIKGFLRIEKQGKTYELHKLTEDSTMLSKGERKIEEALFKKSNSIAIKQSNHSKLRKAISNLQEQLELSFMKLNFKKNISWWVPGLLLSIANFTAILILSFRDEEVFVSIIFGGFISCFSLVFIWAFYSAAKHASGIAKIILSLITAAISLGFIGFGYLLTTNFGTDFSLLFKIAPYFLIIGSMLLMNILFYHLMKAPTIVGRKRMDEIEGLKMYLEVAEKHRLDKLNPPEMTPQLFEKLLPFAIALNVENKWGEQFDDILEKAIHNNEYNPTWYSGSAGDTFRAHAFASALGTNFSSAISSASVSPQSSSSSGSGGGGFSGGGGGGGGGGGW